MKRLPLLLGGLFLAFSFFSLFAAETTTGKSAPAFTTDKPVYAAGETATLRGENWPAGEPVIIVITPEGGGEATTLRTMTDSSGAFSVTSTIPEGEKFHATASGAISKLTVPAQFSSGAIETDGAHLLDLERYWEDRLTFPTGKFNPGWVRKASEQDKKIARGTPQGKKKGHSGISAAGLSVQPQHGTLVLNGTAFTALGPQPEHMTGCSGCFNYTTTQGRVNNIAVDPTTTTKAASWRMPPPSAAVCGRLPTAAAAPRRGRC
jgi:hypothetical protein